jgi:hypothetical protein
MPSHTGTPTAEPVRHSACAASFQGAVFSVVYREPTVAAWTPDQAHPLQCLRHAL